MAQSPTLHRIYPTLLLESFLLDSGYRMREQIGGWQKRLNQAWLVRVENWKRDQGHCQSQLEMLNPQRTLERGYAVILDKHKGLNAVRKPEELKVGSDFEVKLSGGFASVRFSKVEIKR